MRHGHLVSYVGLFLFTVVLYFRPYELFPVLSSFSFMAKALALFTLAVYIPSQVALEGTITARLREVKLLLLLAAAGLLSIPLALNPGQAWATFNDPFFKAVLIFVVMVNVVRTRRRLLGLFILALAVSCNLSVDAINDYQSGRLGVEGYRVEGSIGNLFGNPNDMAMHLVTMIPIAVALFLSARGTGKKLLYGACALLMVAGSTVTYSRAGFLGLAAVILALAWKLGRRNRVGVMFLTVALMAAFMALAPSNYGERVASIFDSGLDAVGSSHSRMDLLVRSVLVALKNPLFGVGMGNFHTVSIQEQVSHNAYMQVAAEMGIPAAVFYTLFVVSPLLRLREIERQTAKARRTSPFYYLSVGLQASLIGYMVGSFFASVAYLWYIYYLVGYAVCLRRLYETMPGLDSGPGASDQGRKEARARAGARGTSRATSCSRS